MRATIAGLVALLAAPAGQEADAPAAPGERGRFEKPWHVRLPRKDLLAAWERLRNLDLAGAGADSRFKIAGPILYVSPAGNDSSDGSRDRPWRTLAFAVRQLRPGTVLCLRRGTYFGPVEITTKATAGAPAALRAAEGEEVLVTYRESWVKEMRAKFGGGDAVDSDHHYPPLVSLHGATHVEVSGLRLAGVRDRLMQNKHSENGISIAGGGGEGCRILLNEIENVGHCGIKEMGHGGRAFLVEGNLVHDVGHTAHDHGTYLPANDVVVRKNLFLNAAGYGVHAYSEPERTTVVHNICAGNDAYGVIMAGPGGTVAHNVFYGNKRGGLLFYRSGCRDIRAVNNIFVETGAAVSYDTMGGRQPGPSGNTVDANCLAPDTRLPSPTRGNTHGPANFTADPKAAAPERLDFRLLEGSPCRGRGMPLGPGPSGRAPDVGCFPAVSRP